MQLLAALLGILWIVLPLTTCVKKDLKSMEKDIKYAEKDLKSMEKDITSIEKRMNKTRTKRKQDKRWMSTFAQNFITSQPVQRYSMQYNQDIDNEPTPSRGDEFRFGDEQDFQGLKELKMPKTSETLHESPAADNSHELNAADPTANFANEIAAYLKPGIGDDPSDMPGGMKNFGASLSGVGLPINGKLRASKLAPVASFNEPNEENQGLPPHKDLSVPSTSSAVIPVLSEPLPDTSAMKIFDEMPGKIAEESPSVVESSKSFSGAGESPMIASPSIDSASLAPSDATVAVPSDTNENTSTDKTEKPDKTDDKSNKEGNESSPDTTGGKEKETASDKPADSDKPDVPDAVAKLKKPKQKPGDSPTSNDTATKQGGHRSHDWNMEHTEPIGLPSSKPIRPFSDKDEKVISLVNPEDTVMINATSAVEDDGDEEEKTPNKVKEKLVSSLREALLENVKEMLNGENSKQLLEEAQTVTDDKPEKTDKGKSDKSGKPDKPANTTNIKTVSVQEEDEEGSAENVTPLKNIDSNFAADDSKVPTTNSETTTADSRHEEGRNEESRHEESKSAESKSASLLESNLMKIDKKKLAHLLATLMKRYKGSVIGSVEKSIEKNIESNKAAKAGNEENEEKDSEKKHEKIKLDKPKEEERNITDEKALLKPSKDPKLVRVGHHENALSREKYAPDAVDPYAQIGLTDPKMSGNPALTNVNHKADTSGTGRHSVHINLFGDEIHKSNDDSLAMKASKEFQGKVESETARAEEIVNEKVEKQKERAQAEVAKAHATEGLENEMVMKQKAKQVKEEDSKNIKGTMTDVEREMSNNNKQNGNFIIEHMKGNRMNDGDLTIKAGPGIEFKPNTVVQMEEKQHEKLIGNQKLLEPSKEQSMDFVSVSSQSTNQPKNSKGKEQKNVELEIEKEKQELKMLREQAKLEKAKEGELKASNAVLQEKDKKENAAFLEKMRLQQESSAKTEDEKEKQLEIKESQLKVAKEAEEERERLEKIKENQLKTARVQEEEKERMHREREKQLKAERAEENAERLATGKENLEEQTAKVESIEAKAEKAEQEQEKAEGEKGGQDKSNENQMKNSKFEEEGKEKLENIKEKQPKDAKFEAEGKEKLENLKEGQPKDGKFEAEGKENLENLKENQLKDAKFEAEGKERLENLKENQLKNAKFEAEGKERLENLQENQLKGAKFEAEGKERLENLQANRLKPVKFEAGGKEKLENIDEKQLKYAKMEEEKEKSENIEVKKLGKDNKEGEVKVTGMNENERNRKEPPIEKAKESELIAIESAIVEKQKGEKKKEELKVAGGEKEDMKGKQQGAEEKANENENTVAGKGDLKKEISESRDKNELDLPKYGKETLNDITSYNGGGLLKTAHPDRYIHLVSPELVNAITDNIRNAKMVSATSPTPTEGKADDATPATGIAPFVAKDVRVPTHAAMAEKEAGKISNLPLLEGKESIDGNKEKLSIGKESVEAKQDKPLIEGKETMESKTYTPSIDGKESIEGKQGKLATEGNGHIEAKHDGPSTEGKGFEQDERAEAMKEIIEKQKQEGSKQKGEKGEELGAMEGPNIETLIEHMEERMRERKKENNPKEGIKTGREAKKRTRLGDDAYTQIGPMDTNLKKRRILMKMKKHLRRHRMKTKKH